MRIVLMITARCNASCAHCSTSCGPTRTEALSSADARAVIDQAANLDPLDSLEICITGGEPFLDFPNLKNLISFGAERGALMSCVTNGYWASSPDKAAELLGELAEAGLRLLAISTSRFHTAFVSRRRVNNALGAARDIGLETVLKYVQTAADENLEHLKAEALESGATWVQVIPVMPHIRERVDIPETWYPRTAGLPQGACPGAVLNIAETGRAYMCCTPGAVSTFHAVGELSRDPLATIYKRFLLGPKQQVLRTHGPQFFAAAIRDAGLGHRLRDAYANPCDLCTHIANEGDLADVAEAAAVSYTEARLNTLFPPIGRPT